MWEHLVDFLVAFAALGVPTLAFVTMLHGRDRCEPPLVLLGGLTGTCLLAYVAFWAWFLSPRIGTAWTFIVLAGAFAHLWRHRPRLAAALSDDDVWGPLVLMVLVGVMYIGLLHLFATPLRLDRLSAARYMLAMPVDNELPRRFAERLIFGNTPHHFYETWLSSDRPPLQVGIIVLAEPVAEWTAGRMMPSAHAAGMWFQLFWMPAVWALARRMSFDVPRAALLCALTSATSLTMFHSVYLWPKLGGGALAIGAFVLYASRRDRDVPTLIGVAAMSGLAWLAHGGTIFSLLAMAVMALAWPTYPSLRALAAGLATFLLLALPWTAYQKLYDPPGDRLIKWHLGGVIDPDPRGALEVVVDQYRRAGWPGTVYNKKANFLTLIGGFDQFTFALDRPRDRRIHEWYYFFRSFNVWNVALLAAPIAFVRRRRAGLSASMVWATLAWVLLTLVDWCLIAFGPPTYTINHAGSLASHLTLYVVMYACAWSASRTFFWVVAVVHAVTTAITWLPSTAELAQYPVAPDAAVLAAAGALAMGGLVTYMWRRKVLPVRAAV
jgi:hypothetical protein